MSCHRNGISSGVHHHLRGAAQCQSRMLSGSPQSQGISHPRLMTFCFELFLTELIKTVALNMTNLERRQVFRKRTGRTLDIYQHIVTIGLLIMSPLNCMLNLNLYKLSICN